MAAGKKTGGRQKGSLNKKTREIAVKAATGGLTPLDVMLGNMVFYAREADIALQALLGASPAAPADVIAQHDPKQLEQLEEGQSPSVIDAFKILLGLRDKAGEAAKDAAPYVHARLTPVEHKDRGEDIIPLAERLKAYATTEAIAASDGKVVALKARR